MDMGEGRMRSGRTKTLFRSSKGWRPHLGYNKSYRSKPRRRKWRINRPSGAAQDSLLKQVWSKAKIKGSQLDYIERMELAPPWGIRLKFMP